MGIRDRSIHRSATAIGVWLLAGSTAYAGPAALLATLPQPAPPCGALYARPFAERADGIKVRPCNHPVARRYTPTHRGLGFEALDLETAVCFVPDGAYRLLDEVVDEVTRRVGLLSDSADAQIRRAQFLLISKTTGDVLAERGFGLYIPTETLGDALVARSEPGETPRHVIDCDTSSLILLTVAQALNLPAAMVEVTLPGGAGHNFVRWSVNGTQTLDWDTNGRSECTMQSDNPPFQGHDMNHDETIAYLLTVRAQRWIREGKVAEGLEDDRQAIVLNPRHPVGYNNFAWSVATRVFPDRDKLKMEAMSYLKQLLAIQRSPNNLDTAGCLSAYIGDYKAAFTFESEASRGEPANVEFKARAALFASPAPHDCTGAV